MDEDEFKTDSDNHLVFQLNIEAEINLLFAIYTKGIKITKSWKYMLDEMLRRLGPGHE